MTPIEELYHFMDYLLVRGFANHDDSMFRQGLMMQVTLAEIHMEENGNEILDIYMDYYKFTTQDKSAFCDKVIEESDKSRLQLWSEWKTLHDELFAATKVEVPAKEKAE